MEAAVDLAKQNAAEARDTAHSSASKAQAAAKVAELKAVESKEAVELAIAAEEAAKSTEKKLSEWVGGVEGGGWRVETPRF